jgi:hypothetical protein
VILRKEGNINDTNDIKRKREKEKKRIEIALMI